MSRPTKMFVDLQGGPDDRDRFRVFSAGRESFLSIDQIKAAVARGDTLEEWETKR